MAGPARGAMWSHDTLSWQLNSRWFVLIGGPRAAILQICHPSVAAGVADHSAYRTDALGRLERTLDAMLTIGFGTPARREKVLAGLQRAHDRVVGTRPDGAGYHANDPDLQYWVLATLTDTVLEVERRYVGRLRRPDREAYFQESKAMADAFGVPRSTVPDDLDAFRDYVAGMVATLQPSEQSRDIARSLMHPGLRFVPDPAFVPLNWVTAELLPTRLRRELGVRRLNPAELAAVRTAQTLSRSTLPHLGALAGANPLNSRALRGAA